MGDRRGKGKFDPEEKAKLIEREENVKIKSKGKCI